MKTIKILKANNLQEVIDSYISKDYQLIYAFNKAVKDETINIFMNEHKFRNYKVMELSLVAAKRRSLKWSKIMNDISNKYSTPYCGDEVYNEIIEMLNRNI